MWASPETTWAARPQRFAPAIARRIRTIFPQLGRVEICGGLGRRGRADRARHAADRPVAEGTVGRQRLRPPGPEHVGDGRAVDRPQHPVGRRALAAVFAVRTGLGRWRRPAGSPDMPSACGGEAVPPPPARWPATGSGRGCRERIREARLAEANRQAGTRPPRRRPPPRPRRSRRSRQAAKARGLPDVCRCGGIRERRAGAATRKKVRNFAPNRCNFRCCAPYLTANHPISRFARRPS